ncbi:MAG: ThuA domain-containing protein [Chloroflexi bacterium]|nr:ThuA domain-containing protein [Chloroflexota bacterium]
MASKPKVLLLVGGAPYHDQPEHREILARIFGAEFDLTVADSPDVLTPEGLARYVAIANYTSFWEPPQAQCQALLDAVKGGVGLACLHTSSASFYNCPAYQEMVGGEFTNHDPNKLFTVKIGDARSRKRQLANKGLAVPEPPHPITQGISDFQIQDELFIIEGDQTQWQVLARAEGHPVIYTKMWGKGRVCMNALGHDGRALGNPSLQTLYLRGVQWVANLI